MTTLERCPLCPGINNVVPGGGPLDADCMFVFEAPGPDENKHKRCMQGKTGQEYDQQYLPLAGLSRTNVYTTNVIKCLPPGDGKIVVSDKRSMDMAKSCAEFHLYQEIQRVNPKVIVLGGAFANSLVPDINLDLHHGMPFEWTIDPNIGTYTIFPMWHPAQGLYDHKRIGTLRTDFIRLRKFLTNRLVVPYDEFPEPLYMEIKTGKVLHHMLQGMHEWPIAIDTETTRKRHPFCLTFSVRPGEGFLVRAGNTDVLQVFAEYLAEWEAEILIHNSLFDIPVLRKMQAEIRRKRLVDTMMKVYHLQNMPQGLKVLSYRLLGMEMQDFDDLVSPYSTSRVLGYYADANTIKWPKADPFLDRDKDGKWHYHQPQSLNTKIKRFFTDYGKNPDLNVFERWDKWITDHEQVQAAIGEYPGKCITHVPFDKALFYACRDADATLRLWPIIKRALARQRRMAESEWWESAA